MKLGLITDVHEHVEQLTNALERFRREGVEQVVFIGDAFETGVRIDETCRLLADARVIGVWGNHDYGLCQPDEYVRSRYSPAVLDYMTSLRPRQEIDGCHFSHVEPWLNPEIVGDLWYFEGMPNDEAKRERIFNAVPHRVMFAGHFHRWLLVTPAGIDEWQGERPIRLDGDRYFVVINAVCEGCCAIFDTVSSELTPFWEE